MGILLELSETLHELIGNIALLSAVIILGIFLIRSIWREVKQREKLETLTQELKKLSEIKTQFILATQHHIKGPLGAMRWYLDLILAGDYGKVPKEITKVRR